MQINTTRHFDPFTDLLARSLTSLARMEKNFRTYIRDVTSCITDVCEEIKVDFFFECRGYRLGVKKFRNRKKQKYIFILSDLKSLEKASYRTFEDCLDWVEGSSELSLNDCYFLYKNLPCILTHLNKAIESRLNDKCH